MKELTREFAEKFLDFLIATMALQVDFKDHDDKLLQKKKIRRGNEKGSRERGRMRREK